MTSATENASRLAELEGLLEAWGGEPSRWPPEVRERVAALAALGGMQARALVEEARALDRLLDHGRDAPATMTPAAQDSLADRIVAAALTETAAGGAARRGPGQVIQLPARNSAPAARAVRQPLVPASRWQAAGLMAASLLAGIYLGGSVNLAPVMQELAEVVGMQTVIDPLLASLNDDLNDEETP